jgi:hypothetical protein
MPVYIPMGLGYPVGGQYYTGYGSATLLDYFKVPKASQSQIRKHRPIAYHTGWKANRSEVYSIRWLRCSCSTLDCSACVREKKSKYVFIDFIAMHRSCEGTSILDVAI